MCLPQYKTFIHASRGSPLRKHLSELMLLLASSRWCTCMQKYGDAGGQIINASAQTRPESNVQRNAHLILTGRLLSPAIVSGLSLLPVFLPEIPVNMFVLRESVGGE